MNEDRYAEYEEENWVSEIRGLFFLVKKQYLVLQNLRETHRLI